jgi:hypothetical protein
LTQPRGGPRQLGRQEGRRRFLEVRQAVRGGELGLQVGGGAHGLQRVGEHGQPRVGEVQLQQLELREHEAQRADEAAHDVRGGVRPAGARRGLQRRSDALLRDVRVRLASC